MDDFKRFVGQIPPVTRYFCGFTLLLSFCMTYKILGPELLILDFSLAFGKFQIWRLITTFFFVGPFSMSFLFGMMMVYYSVSSIEAYFDKRQADLGVMLVFNALAVMFVAFLANNFYVLQSPYIFSLIYVWSKFVPDQQMSIWGFPVQSLHLPWVLMGFHLFTGGDPFNDLIGVAAGHCYVYLKEVLPDSHGYDLLKTPKLMQIIVDKLNGVHGIPANQRNAGRVNFMNNDGAQANLGA